MMMNTATNLNTVSPSAELPVEYHGRTFDDMLPHGNRWQAPPADPPSRGTVHYGPGHRPLCGDDDELAFHTQDPQQVVGCEECLELVAEDLADDNEYRGRCLHCRREITAQGGVAWRRIVRNRCPHCGKPGW